MMKFFRKYNKTMIAVLVIFLMIVFLGGDALQSLASRNPDVLIAKSRLGDISVSDQAHAKDTGEILELLRLPWKNPFPLPGPLTEIDWVLLAREVELLSTQMDAAAARNVMVGPEIAQAVANIAFARRVKQDRVWQAIAEFTSIQETARSIGAAAAPSEAEVRSMSRMALDKVKVRAVVLPAEPFLPKDAKFSESQLQEQFAKYKDREAGKGLSFGYKISDSVKLQYIRIDKEALAKKVGVANLEKKAERYYEERKEIDLAFRRPAPVEPATEEEKAASPILNFAEAKEAAVGAVRAAQADEIALRMADWLIENLSTPWYEATTERDGYKSVPAIAQNLNSMDEATKRFPETLNYKEVVEVRATEFFTQAEANDVADIGGAALRPSKGSPVPMGTIAFRTKPFLPEAREGKATLPDGLAPFQVFQSALRDAKGNLYIFRVIETRAAFAPPTIELVVDKVKKDLSLLAAFDHAKVRASGLVDCEHEGGLKEAFESDTELVQMKSKIEGRDSGFFEPGPFARIESYAAGKATRGPVSYIGGVGFVPNEVVEKIFALEHLDRKIAMYELPDRASVLVAEWREAIQGREDEFEELRERVASELTSNRGSVAIRDWLSPEKVRLRNKFEPVIERLK